MIRMTALGLVLVTAWGCGVIGPTCLARQEEGPVRSIVGEVAPGQTAAHTVSYDTNGSQNNARVSWVGQTTAGGPRIRVYATTAGCSDFRPPPAVNGGACAVLASAGSIDGQVVSSLVITHGRGNPEVLGSPPAYVLWVVGDPSQSARYTIDITWFFGPDC